jgi:putative FmdB family regulatory protein
MPLYEYVCNACGGKFEAYVRAWNEAVSCPGCGAADVDKQLSTFAFTGTDGGFRGSVGGGCGCGRGGCGCGH